MNTEELTDLCETEACLIYDAIEEACGITQEQIMGGSRGNTSHSDAPIVRAKEAMAYVLIERGHSTIRTSHAMGSNHPGQSSRRAKRFAQRIDTLGPSRFENTLLSAINEKLEAG